jgi:hypothetical protein
MDEEQELFDFMVAIGALVPIGKDKDTGEEVYQFTDKADEVIPEFTEMFFDELNSEIFFLWQKDFVSLFFDDDGDPLIGPAEKAYETDSWKELDMESAFILKQILAIFDESIDEWYTDEEGDDDYAL